MRKRMSLIGAMLPLLCLSSCKSASFSYDHIDLRKEYILYRNIDCKEGTQFLRYSTAGEVIDAVDNGEDILLLYTNETCHTCQEVMPKVLEEISHLCLNIFTISENTSEGASLINRYIAEKGIKKVVTRVMDGGTPSMYLFSKNALTEVFYGSNGKSNAKVVLTALKEYTTCSGIDYCTEEYSHANPSALTYILDKSNDENHSFYYSSLFPKASRTTKSIQVLDVTNITKEEKEGILDMYDSSNDENAWNIDSFDGWFVSQTERIHFKDPSIASYLEEYFRS